MVAQGDRYRSKSCTLQDDAKRTATERAAHIREVGRALTARDAPTRDQARDQGRRIEATKKDTAALYKELEDQLQRRDKARGKQRTRDRGDGEPER
jgi:hypothetical protein